MSQSARDVEDYTGEFGGAGSDSHYRGVKSMYGRLVEEQQKEQPKYCWPGEAGGELEGAHRNEQSGP